MANDVNYDDYDSRQATLDHIDEVRSRLQGVINRLGDRGIVHDRSKLEEPEKSVFDTFTPKLKHMQAGTPEYEEARVAMGEGLRHHYANNSHHPEHFSNGIFGMSLLDVIEMLCDWDAATKRHEPPGDLEKWITTTAKERFGYCSLVEAWLLNTARELGYIKGES